MNTFVFLRSPLVPVACPAIGTVGTAFTATAAWTERAWRVAMVATLEVESCSVSWLRSWEGNLADWMPVAEALAGTHFAGAADAPLRDATAPV